MDYHINQIDTRLNYVNLTTITTVIVRLQR